MSDDELTFYQKQKNNELAMALNCLNIHLSNDLHRIRDYKQKEALVNSLVELKKWYDSKDDGYLDSEFSEIIASDDTGHKMFAKKLSEMMDMMKMSLISHPESLQPPTYLEDKLLKALSCFVLFGENALLKKREIIYWWIGLGLIHDGEDAEMKADQLLSSLVEAGAIEQDFCLRENRVSRKYRLLKNYNQQQQSIDHQKVGILRKEGTLLMLTDSNGTPITETFDKAQIETLFNSDVSTLDIRRDWLRKMGNLKVLHLGRWSSNDPEQIIEVEQAEFLLQSLKYLKEVRFISLKEVSRIMELGYEICSLGKNLRVLDLKACPHLEVIPKEIGKLKNLTHLDLSQCYLLYIIPKGITSLSKLQVLEGFVISDVNNSSSCKFKELANHLGKSLRKLSITTRKISFPAEDDLKAFSKFEKLLKLKVAWIRVSDFDEEEELQGKQEDTLETKDVLHSRRRFRRSLAMTNSSAGLPKQLQKLEVQDIPPKAMKSLLCSDERWVENLKKLYIIGGEFNDLTNQGKVWENVETLRLKYLTKLNIRWLQLKASFPQLTLLEVTHCPNLKFFPCDHNGIWRAG